MGIWNFVFNCHDNNVTIQNIFLKIVLFLIGLVRFTHLDVFVSLSDVYLQIQLHIQLVSIAKCKCYIYKYV